jgi:hypothetical protein
MQRVVFLPVDFNDEETYLCYQYLVSVDIKNKMDTAHNKIKFAKRTEANVIESFEVPFVPQWYSKTITTSRKHDAIRIPDFKMGYDELFEKYKVQFGSNGVGVRREFLQDYDGDKSMRIYPYEYYEDNKYDIAYLIDDNIIRNQKATIPHIENISFLEAFKQIVDADEFWRTDSPNNKLLAKYKLFYG